MFEKRKRSDAEEVGFRAVKLKERLPGDAREFAEVVCLFGFSEEATRARSGGVVPREGADVERSSFREE